MVKHRHSRAAIGQEDRSNPQPIPGEPTEPRQRPAAYERWLLPSLDEGPLQGLSEGVLITDATDNIQWANSVAAEMTGWTSSELQGMPLRSLISTEELREIAENHCLLRTESGERREVSVSVGRSPRATWPVVIYLLRDLRRQRERDRGLAEFGDEASVVAHDLRKLIHILAITIRNLRSHLDNPAARERTLQALETVTSQTTHVIGQLSQVSTLSKVDRRRSMLSEVIQRVLELLRSSGWQAQLAATDIQIAEPFPCVIDVPGMVQVLFNVLVNAYEAVKEDGRVSLRAHFDPTLTRLQLVVEDTGCGFPRAYLELPFQRFRSTKPGGTGLGLYQAKRVVEAHGGRLDIANRADSNGARVIITLPAS